MLGLSDLDEATMIRLKAYKYRLKPRVDQMTQPNKHFGHVRFVKNLAIALKGRYYRRFGEGLPNHRLLDLKQAPTYQKSRC